MNESKNCPRCKEPLPKDKFVHGTWRCPHCGNVCWTNPKGIYYCGAGVPDKRHGSGPMMEEPSDDGEAFDAAMDNEAGLDKTDTSLLPNHDQGFNDDSQIAADEEREEKKREKPTCKLVGEDGNIFNLIGLARRALSKAGQNDKAKEMCKRLLEDEEASSYDGALRIIQEYVEAE